MIARVTRFAVDHRLAVVLSTVGLAMAAAILGARLELDALPDITNNQVLVLTRASALTPEEVERLVTRPIELSLAGAPGLDEVRSISRYGISSVTAVFADDVDPYRARQLVSERLASVALPPEVVPELGPHSGGLGEVFHLTLASPTRSLAELSELSASRVIPLLKAVPGVVEVNAWGGAQRTLVVEVAPARLAAQGLSLEAVRSSLESTLGSRPGGALPHGDGQALVRAVSRPVTADELGPQRLGPGVRVDQVAEVHEGLMPRLGSASADGRGELLYVMAQMLRDANALEVTAALGRQLELVRAQLPPDVEVRVVYDRGALVWRTLRTVAKNLAEGFGLVVLVLFLFLGSWRAGVVVASVIPLAMAFSTAAMVLVGVPGNLMSLGALDFGLLVDGAVVLIEGVFHLRRARGDAPLAFEDSVREVAAHSARPIFFSVLVIWLVYLPVLSLQGVDGVLFRPMALTVLFALGAALVLTFTFVPALASLWLKPGDVPAREPWLPSAFARVYPAALGTARAHPRRVLGLSLVLLALGALALRSRGLELTPQLDEGHLVIQTTRAPDSSLLGSVAAAALLERSLLTRFPEVRHVVSRVGSPAVATDIMGFEQADVFVELEPRERWRPGLERAGLLDELSRALAEDDPHAQPAFTQPIQMRFNELLGGAVTDVAIGVYGDALDSLEAGAQEIAARVATVDGAHDVRVLAPPSVPVRTVTPEPAALSAAGASARDVLELVQASGPGLAVGLSYDGLVPVPVMLTVTPPADADLLGGVMLPLAAGAMVPLEKVARIDTRATPGLVSHKNGERRLVVGFNVRGSELGTVVAGAKASLGALPPGIRRVEWGGQFETLEAATRRLAVVVPVVLALVVGVLALAFGRMRPALLIFLHVPFAGVGGAFALWLRDLPLSLPAIIGFIALSGVAVMNGVVLLTRVHEREREGVAPGEAAREAALERARPVLMTALVAALGFVPMVLATGVGSEVQRPLATVVVGGLVTSTMLTLFILPSLYAMLVRIGARRA